LSVRAISADGSTLVGNAGPQYALGNPSGPAFRWRRGEAIEWLGSQLDDGSELHIADVNEDGSWIAATLFTLSDQRRSAAVRIGPDGIIEELAADGEAAAISADGNIVVGAATPTPSEEPVEAFERAAFRWNATTGLEALPLFPFEDALEPWRPSDTSADGSIIMGSGGVLFASFCVTYVAGVGISDPCMEGGPALSADGSLAVTTRGSGRYASGLRALEMATGEQLDLGFPSPSNPGAPSSLATAINSDGSVVFGVGEAVDDTLSARAYVWRRDVGTVPFTQLLQDSCVDTAAIPHSSWQVTALSGDSHLAVVCTLLNDEGHCYVAAWQ
jgi:hypothetical protein